MRLRRQRTESKMSALANGLDTGSGPVEDLLGSLADGGYNSGRHSIKRRAEIFVGFRHAPLFQK